MAIVLTKEQVENQEYKAYSPVTNSFEWHEDGSCTVRGVCYWDEASYINHQGDNENA
jgi:hypothetical protein